MDYKKQLKRRNLIALWYILILFLSVALIITGGVILDEVDETIGLILLISGLLIMLISVTWVIVVSISLNKKIRDGKKEVDLKELSTKTGIRIFKSGENCIEFFGDYFTIDEMVKYYKDYNFVAAFDTKDGDLKPIVLFSSNENELHSIAITKDLLDTFRECEITIFNQEELDFYIDNYDIALKQANKFYSFNPAPFILMEFNKNKVDAKKFSKRNWMSFLISAASFIIFLGINIFLIWMSDSKEGNNFAELIGFDLIVKLIFSGVLIFLIFNKSKDFKLSSKLSIGMYLILYWISLLYGTSQTDILISIIFMFIFIVVGICEAINRKEKTKNNFYNRFFGLATFLMLMLIFTLMDITLVDDTAFLLPSLFITLAIMVIEVIVLVLYHKKKKEIKKKEKVVAYISTLFFTITVGFFIIYAVISSLNFALDKSTPKVETYEIIKLNKGGDNSSDSATVLINKMEIKISITSEEYNNLEVGDMIEVCYYEGAFNEPYYIHYRE